MAARFWVTGGTGNWNSTTNWSATSGGASGASVPGSADTATLNANSGSGTVTLDISPTIQTLTCTGFTGTLAFGTNTISLNSTGTIFTGVTTMAVTGTPLIICTNSSATARTITPTAVTEANSISFRITAGTGTLTLSTNSAVRDLDFTDGTNPTGFAGSLASNTASIFGSLKASTGMLATAGAQVLTFAATSGTQTINTAGVTFDRPLVFSGAGGTWQLQAALTSGSTRTCNLAIGTLDLNGYTLTTGLFTSSNSNIRTLAFGSTGKFVLTGTGATLWTTSTSTNLTVTGTNPLIQLTTNSTTGTRGVILGAAGESNSISVDVTAGSDQINLSTTNGAYRNVNFTGFTGTVSVQNSILVFGNWNYGGTTIQGAGTSTVTFSATSGTKTITSNGFSFPGNVTFNGVGGTWSLQDALTLPSTGTLTLTNGTLTTNSYAVTAGVFSSSNTNTRTLNLGASTVTLTTTGNVWSITDATNLTLNAGTSTIVTSSTAASISFVGAGLTYYNLTFGATYYNVAITGANTFNNVTLASPAGVGRRALNISASQTINGTLSCSGSAVNSRPRLVSTSGVITLTAASVSLANADFSGITAAGTSSPWSGASLGNMGGNTNITFATPKTVYWNQPAGGNWSDAAWATSSGGTVSINNFPLAQDTAILDNTGVGASTTIVIDYGWNLPALNASSLTNALTLNWNAFATLVAGFYGSITLSSAISITAAASNGTAINALANASITSAGVVFDTASQFSFNPVPGTTITLVDDFNSTATSTFFINGTIDLNGKTLTCTSFTSSYTNARAISFNGGNITVTGNNATVWSCADLTNFSYTGTPTVNFTYSGSVGTRSVANGVTGLTEANAVDFNIVAGGDTWSSSGTPNGVRNWTFQPAFTGSSSFYANGFIYGNVLLSPNQTVLSGATGPTFAATSGTKTITTNGVTIDRPLTFNGVGGTWSLQSALTLGATNGNLTVSGGTFNTNNYNITAATFSGSGTSVRAINLGSSTITVSGSGTLAVDFSVPTNLTLNSGTSTFDLTNTSATKFFQGGGLTFYKVRISGNSQTNINGGNTRFQELSNTVTPLVVQFGNLSNPMYFDNFSISGTAGNLVTLQSATPGTRFLLAKNTGGKVLVSYVSITDSAATPAGYWFAPTSQGNVNGGNNTGWNFGTAGGAGGFLPFF